MGRGRVASMAQSQHCSTEGFRVRIALTGGKLVWLRHNLTAPWPGALQAVWGQGERDKLHARYPSLGIEPLPEYFGGIGIVPVIGHNGPAPLVHRTRPTIGLPTMPL